MALFKTINYLNIDTFKYVISIFIIVLDHIIHNYSDSLVSLNLKAMNNKVYCKVQTVITIVKQYTLLVEKQMVLVMI